MQNRKIAFRAWHKILERMDYEPSVDCSGSEDYEINDAFSYSDLIFMQFTGLHDKTGKPIFEGDIVIYKVFANENAIKGEVKFSEKSASFYVSHGMNFRLITDRDEIEVIGNIYESSHLLKKDEQ